MQYHSQFGQDRFILEQVFPNKTDGTFIEIGANDGLYISNTLTMEQIGWQGLCIEANPVHLPELRKNRKQAIGCCVTNLPVNQVDFLQITGYAEPLSGILQFYNPQHLARIDREIAQYGGSKQIIKVPAKTLTDICLQQGLTHVNYLSLDVEGSEWDIIQSIDFDQINIDVISFEVNYRDESAHNSYLHLLSKGYQYIGCTQIDHFYSKLK